MIDEARLFGLMSQTVTALDKVSGALALFYDHTPEVRQIRSDNENYKRLLTDEHENTKLRIRQRRCMRRVENSLKDLLSYEKRRTMTHHQIQQALKSILYDVTTTLDPKPKAEKED